MTLLRCIISLLPVHLNTLQFSSSWIGAKWYLMGIGSWMAVLAQVVGLLSLGGLDPREYATY